MITIDMLEHARMTDWTQVTMVVIWTCGTGPPMSCHNALI